MLVFSNLGNLDHINEERIKLHHEQIENERIIKKQKIYTQMANA